MTKNNTLSRALWFVLALAPVSFSLSGHQFSTSYLQVDTSDDATRVEWEWRLVNHDVETLFPALDFTSEGKLTSLSEAAILQQLQNYLQLSGCGLAAELSLTNVISYYAGQPHLTMSGTYNCEAASEHTLRVSEVFTAIDHHKVIVTNAQGDDLAVLSETQRQLNW